MKNIKYRIKRIPAKLLIYGVCLTFVTAVVLTILTMRTGKMSKTSVHGITLGKRDRDLWPDSVDQQGTFSEKRPAVLLVILVMASPQSENTRNIIRQTWANNLPQGSLVRFIIGVKNLENATKSKLQEEQHVHQDVVLLQNIEESYRGLSVKLLAMFEWVYKKIDAKFVMKVDEDSFVRVDLIVNELANKDDDKLYWGFFDGRARVYKRGKWAEKDYVLCDRYIPYALGGGYIVSSDIVKYIHRNSEDLITFQSEDVSLGTWLAPLRVRRIHDPRFDTEFKSRGCLNSYIVLHKRTPSEMQILYNNLKTTGRLCPKEYKTRLSYIYDWNNLPTQCCNRTDPRVP